MHKLQKIKRKDLNVEKYSKALNKALNYRIYAEVWYLDILTDGKWECWIFGDYEVVMPVPLQFKFGIKFVIMPIYCQQLGVFYKEEISDELFKEFERKIHKYRVRSYCFNEENTERYNPKGEKRVNYILDLNRSYEEIFDDYSRNKRRDIRKSERLGTTVQESADLQKFIDLYHENYPHLISSFTAKRFLGLLNLILEKKCLILYEIMNEKNQIIAMQLLINTQNRIIYLGFARNKTTENHNSASRVMDFFIKKNASKNLILDFEGSVNPKIAHFMKGFGVSNKFYSKYLNFNFLLTKRIF